MRFIDNDFKMSSEPTIGVQFGSKTIKVHNKIVKLQIWDTVNMERKRPARKHTSQSLAPTTGELSAWCQSMIYLPSPLSRTQPSGWSRPRTSPPTRTSKQCSSVTKAIKIMSIRQFNIDARFPSIRPLTLPRRIRSPSSRAPPKQDLILPTHSSCSLKRQLKKQNQVGSIYLMIMEALNQDSTSQLICRSEERRLAADVIQFYLSY